MKRILRVILAALILASIAYFLMGFGVRLAQANGPEKITVCHDPGPTQETIEIPLPAWPAHEAHGDYLENCERWEPTNTPDPPTPTPTEPTPTPTDPPPSETPTPSPTPEPDDTPAPTPTETATVAPGANGGDSHAVTGLLWLLTANLDGVNQHCLIFAESHPSVERQNALCWPDLFDGAWVAASAPCAGPVYSRFVGDYEGWWKCDSLTPHRLPLSQLRTVYQKHLERWGENHQ